MVVVTGAVEVTVVVVPGAEVTVVIWTEMVESVVVEVPRVVKVRAAAEVVV